MNSLSSARGTLVFVPLAMNQTKFYVAVARDLAAVGYSCVFVPFHEGSNGYIRANGFKSVNAFALARPVYATPEENAEFVARYGIDNLNALLSHEKAFYEQRDTNELSAKFIRYLGAMDGALGQIQVDYPGPVTLVQELGGFLSVLAGFYAARRLGIDVIFSEPSFYRGRVFFNRNTTAAARVQESAHEPSEPVLRYLEQTRATRAIVIPTKDRSHYVSPVRKVVNARNARRLVEKTLDKYVRGKREEFSYISVHVKRHVRAIAHARKLRKSYRQLPDRPFVYYPLHVPADVALTLRAPEYHDQIALIDYIARNLPITHVLAIKEHPAQVGAISSNRIRELLRARDNVVLLNAGINNHDVLQKAAAVVTVNSKSGAEALMHGRPVLALGDSFYRNSSLVRTASSLTEIPPALVELLREPALPEDRIARFFQGVWDRSFPGEIYAEDPAACSAFADSLAAFIESAPQQQPAAVEVLRAV